MGRESNKKRRAANEQTARARAAAMRLEQQRKERRRQAFLAGGSVVVIIAVVLGIVFYAANHKNKPVSTSGLRVALTAQESSDLAVPAKILSEVGSDAGNGTEFASFDPHTISDPPLASGKPQILFIGAEFCPYCAAERWSIAVALSRFGTLSGLQTMHSSPDDLYPSTPTITFLNSTYSSKYISFQSYEDEDINHNVLQSPSAAATAVWKEYNGESFPFMDFDGKAVITGPEYDPAILKGLTQSQIIADLQDPTSQVGKAIDANANKITAAICLADGNKPASVCTAQIQSIEQGFPAFASSTSGGDTSSSGS